jgi:hypothetical protein
MSRFLDRLAAADSPQSERSKRIHEITQATKRLILLRDMQKPELDPEIPRIGPHKTVEIERQRPPTSVRPLQFPTPKSVVWPPAIAWPPAIGDAPKLSLTLSIAAITGIFVVAGAVTSALWISRAFKASKDHPAAYSASEAKTAYDQSPAKFLITLAPPRAVGEAAPLGVSIRDLGDGGLVVVRGLANGAKLSAGKRMSVNDWWLSALDLETAVIQPPPRFVGVMDVNVELRLPNTVLSDLRTLRFEWQPVAGPPAKAAKVHETKNPVAGNPEGKVPEGTIPGRKVQEAAWASQTTITEVTTTQTMAPVTNVTGQLSHHLIPDDIAALMRRGEDLMASGDFAAARLVLERAAEAGDARAALTLAQIYDPMMPERHQTHGFSSDATIASYWYQKARELGSQRLEVAGH